MARAKAQRQVTQRVVLLVAAALAVFAGSAPSIGTAEPLTIANAGGLWSSDAVTPSGLAGRPAAAPSVLRSVSPAESLPLALPPDVVSQAVPVRLGWQPPLPASAPHAVRCPAGGERAPPGSGIA